MLNQLKLKQLKLHKHAFLCIVFFIFISGLQAQHPRIMTSEFIDTIPVTPSCHASTLIEIPGGLMASWFGGEHESHPEVGIYVSSLQKNKWSKPVQVVNGKYSDGKQYACYNPVLQRYPDGEIVLFYKIGRGPSTWWGMLIRSFDNGIHWTAPEKLPDGIYGPIKNKAYLTKEGVLICPSSTEDKGWKVHVEFTADRGKTWTRTDAITNSLMAGVIQPAMLIHHPKEYEFLMRSQQDTIMSIKSIDGGKHWSALKRTNLPNPNSGIDAVTLKSGTHVLVYNHTLKQGMDRGELNVAISKDGAKWDKIYTLENQAGSEFSYPAIIQSKDGYIHITYTWNRKRIKYVKLNL